MEPSMIVERIRPHRCGGIWQGDWPDEGVRNLPEPLWIVNMADDPEKRDDTGFVDGKQIRGCLYAGITDGRAGVLPDEEYLQLVRVVTLLLREGNHVYIHCWSGWSRSSYITLGVLMSTFHLPYEAALARLKAARPLAQPNQFFAAHLRRLEMVLKGAV